MIAMKKFTPKTSGLTKKEIWDFFYSREGKQYVALVPSAYKGDLDQPYEEPIVSKPAFTANEIPNKLAQMFVDEENELRWEYDSEEDFADARNDLADDVFKKILKALKRKVK